MTHGKIVGTKKKRSFNSSLKIESTFAILDVKRGRKVLYDHFMDVGALGLPVEKEQVKPIPVEISGEIYGVWGEDDGVSREFMVKVTSIKAL